MHTTLLAEIKSLIDEYQSKQNQNEISQICHVSSSQAAH